MTAYRAKSQGTASMYVFKKCHKGLKLLLFSRETIVVIPVFYICFPKVAEWLFAKNYLCYLLNKPKRLFSFLFLFM